MTAGSKSASSIADEMLYNQILLTGGFGRATSHAYGSKCGDALPYGCHACDSSKLGRKGMIAGSKSASNIADEMLCSRHSVYLMAAAGSLSTDPKLPCPEICNQASRDLVQDMYVRVCVRPCVCACVRAAYARVCVCVTCVRV